MPNANIIHTNVLNQARRGILSDKSTHGIRTREIGKPLIIFIV